MGRRRAAVIGKGRRGGAGSVPFMLVLIGAPVLILVYLFGGAAPPGQSRSPPLLLAQLPQAPVSSSTPSLGVTTTYVSLAQPVVTPAASAPVERAAGRTQYVAGRKVALRAEPKGKAEILDRYESGQTVEVLGQSGAWTRVRHALTQREGWIQAKRLRDEPPATEVKAEPEAQPGKVSPALGAASIAKLLIERSIAEYPGPCACPYQSARNGSSCGKRAAYVRPGGYAPLCYVKDVTPEMIAAYRAKH